MIYISSNNVRHPVTKTFHYTSLHYTFRHFTSSHLNYTQLHFTTLSLGLTPFKFPTAPIHLTSLHFTWLHYTSPHITTLHLTSLHFWKIFATILSLSLQPAYNCFPKFFLKILGLQEEVPNVSAGSWFQFLMVLLTKEYFPISILCFLSLIFRTPSILLK